MNEVSTIVNTVNALTLAWRTLAWIGIFVGIFLLAWAAKKINSLVFRHLRKTHQGVHLAYLEKLNGTIIVIACTILAFSSLGGVEDVWKTLLGGTAIISAVVAFAAQDTIKDVLAGFMISIHKPFKLGDRIVLEDGTAGIVENLTMRHVVLKEIDSTRIVIPNSKINAMLLRNFSYERDDRCILFKFAVGYESDMDTVKQVIARAIENSPYTIPGRQDPSGRVGYSPVYFLKFDDSALIMAVSVYYRRVTPTEVVMDDVNVAVRKALRAAGVEIPYNYVNVVHINGESPEDAQRKK